MTTEGQPICSAFVVSVEQTAVGMQEGSQISRSLISKPPETGLEGAQLMRASHLERHKWHPVTGSSPARQSDGYSCR